MKQPSHHAPVRVLLLVLLASAGCGDVKVLAAKDSELTADTGGDVADAGMDSGPGADTAGADAAPKVKISSPASGALINAGSLVHFSATVSDDKDAVDKLKFKWTTTAAAGVMKEGSVDSSGVVELDTADLPAGPQKIKLEVTDSAGNVGSAEVALILNTAPDAPVVAIAPEKPSTIDDLEAQIVQEASDKDRSASALTYAYQWQKNGADTEYKDKVLPNTATTKGETWTVKVHANDPKAQSPDASAQVTIGNAAPVAPALDVSPSAVDLQSEVSCAMAAPPSDPDGDTIALAWSWSIGEYTVPGADTQTITIKDLVAGKGADNKDIAVKAGDKIKCTVTVTDVDSAASSASSPELTIAPFDICASKFNPCDLSAACSNTETLQPICVCNAGFTGDGASCLDIDECITGGAGCDLAANCTNTFGGFTCTCQGGFAGDGKTCLDIDECGAGTAGCDLAADCSNTLGSYACACKAGYAGDGKTCADIDECAAGSASCSLAADCSNTVGGYACACKPGYDGDGKTCNDVDECELGTSECDGNAYCTNIPGAALCACKPGWSGNGKQCADVDECKLATSPCSNDGICTNNLGEFTCACKPGFAGDGKLCTDVDECKDGTAGCGTNTGCTNKPGSFACACLPGFAISNDGKNCVNINECALQPSVCSLNATCADTAGSYVCTCKSGYLGDGKSCSLQDLCSTSATPPNGGCVVNAKCSMVAEKAQCACNPGYSGDGKVSCADINECANGTAGCATTSAGGSCANSAGSFACTCVPGYTGDGKICSDVNECAVNNGGCDKSYGVCTNKTGSFTCACKAGFSGDGKTCTDINECLVSNGGCATTAAGGVCTNSTGGYACSCKAGYSGDGKTCADVNECLVNNGGCAATAAGGVCTNAVGSFACSCMAGFTGDGKTCTDVDECQIKSTCASNATCTNTPGSATCACNSGFQGDGKTCTDIDECGPPIDWSWDFPSQGVGKWLFDPTFAYQQGNPTVEVPGQAPVKWQINAGELYYGNPAANNFETATNPNKGNATGPAIVLSKKPSHKISFELNMLTEPGTQYDRLFVQLVVDGNPITVWDKTKLTFDQLYHKYSFVVQGFGGKTVQVRFAFDTFDGVGNQGKGAFIRNFSIGGVGAPCSANAACSNTIGNYTCVCDGGYVGDGKTCNALGSQAAPATSCNEILSKLGSINYGTYWLAFGGLPAAAYQCDNLGWTLVVNDGFEGGNAGNWSPKGISACGGWGNMLGGADIAGGGYVASNTVVLPAHSQLRANGTYFRMDSWDGEAGWFRVDGVNLWTQTYLMYQPPAGTPVQNQCGNATFSDGASGLNGQVPHSAGKVTLQVGSDLNEPASNEAWGLDNIQVWVK